MDRRLAALTGLGAVGCVAVILYQTLASDQPVYWLSVVLLGALMIVCETLGEEMGGGGRSTYGIIVIFAAITALNTPSAMLVALFGCLHLRLARRREEPIHLIYSGVVYALCAWPAAAIYHALDGVSRAFSVSDTLRSIGPLLLAAAVFWLINSGAMAAALRWVRGVEPRDFLVHDALKLLPNQLIYGLVGMGMGIIYGQNAFHVDVVGQVVGSTAEALRGLFAVVCLLSLLGVAWYFSGKNIELLESYDHSIEVLVTHLEKREPYLDGHALRVADYAAAIAKNMRLPSYEISRVRHAALLHDLGRPAIPLNVLMQKGPLSEEEFDKIKAHPLEGASRLEEVEYLSDMAEAVRHHHEYFDGGGYIDGLRGDTIPLSARIIAVADAYDSMLNERPWREAKGRERAVAELRENSGRQFDPEIVEHFLAALEEESRRAEEGAYAAAEEPPAAAGERKRLPRPRERRLRRREELLQARREARERLEREALEKLGEEGMGTVEEPPAPPEGAEGEAGPEEGPPGGGGEEP